MLKFTGLKRVLLVGPTRNFRIARVVNAVVSVNSLEGIMDFNEWDTDEIQEINEDSLYEDWKQQQWEIEAQEHEEKEELHGSLNNAQLYEEWIDL